MVVANEFLRVLVSVQLWKKCLHVFWHGVWFLNMSNNVPLISLERESEEAPVLGESQGRPTEPPASQFNFPILILSTECPLVLGLQWERGDFQPTERSLSTPHLHG